MTDDFLPVEGHFTSLFNAVAQPPQFVIKNLVPVGLVFVGGPPKKAKKSTFALACASLVAGWECKVLPPDMSEVLLGGPVMLFSYEASADVLKHMATTDMAIKVQDDDAVLVANEPEMFMLDQHEGMDQLFYWLNAKNPRMVIIDPLRNAHALDEKDSAEIRRILVPLRKWAVDNEACVMVLHHTVKTKRDEDAQNYQQADLRGTSALYGLADGIIMITPVLPEASMQFVFNCTFKRGQSWEEKKQLSAYETKGQRAGRALTMVDLKLLEVTRELTKVLNRVQVRDVVNATNFTEHTVVERLKQLVSTGDMQWTTEKGFRVTR